VNLPIHARRSRRSERGAVLVESVVVASLLGLLFASGVFLSRVYEERMAAKVVAVAGAWQGAERGCGLAGGGRLNDPGRLVSGPPPGLSPGFPDPSFLGTFFVVTFTDTRQVVEPPAFGGQTLDFATSETVLCTDPPAGLVTDPQNPLGVIMWAVNGAAQAAGL
jgi:hypothetical protein